MTEIEYELYHAGVKGMKWGVRRYQNKDGSLTPAGKKRYGDSPETGNKKPSYRSTGIKSAMARRSNEKVDKGFKNWKENAQKRDDAIDLGKKATAARLAYENDKSNKTLKTAYKDANKQYKKALSENTSYRKGVVRSEVGKDASRKYLSAAKKVQKQLSSDPSNKDLQKKYNDLMSKHDVERAKARKATAVGAKRSQVKANLKRKMTMTVKAAAGAAAVAAGAYAVNKYLTSHDVTVNGRPIRLGAKNIADVANVAKKAKDLMGFMW